MKMKMYYVFTGGAKIGPISESDFRDMFANGKVMPQDLCWTEGMIDWLSVQEVIGSLRNSPPPPPPPHPAPPFIPTHQHLGSKQIDLINWNPALILYCIGNSLVIMSSIAALRDQEEAASIAFVSLPLAVCGIVFSSLLHHKCWTVLPEPFRTTTPGKAVGFLFIPFYNLYWALVSWPKLAEGLEKWELSLGRRSPTFSDSTKELAQSFAVLFIFNQLSVLFAFFGHTHPLLDILVTTADLCIFIVLYKSITSRMNAILSSV